MKTIEKLENIDKLMEQYQTNDIYSLIEKLHKNQRTEEDDNIKKEYGYLNKVFENLHIKEFLPYIDFSSIQVKVYDDYQTLREVGVISFYLERNK